MEIIDSTMLLLLLRPDTLVPMDANGEAIDKPKERVEFLASRLDKAKTKLIIPTPALSEVLVRAGAQGSLEIIDYLNKFSVFRIEPFDTRAAVEVAAMTRAAIGKGKKRGASDETWAKIKYDRQIVAIARVCGAKTIYSDDKNLQKIAKQFDIHTISLGDLPLPPQKAQLSMELSGVAEGSSNVISEIAAHEIGSGAQ